MHQKVSDWNATIIFSLNPATWILNAKMIRLVHTQCSPQPEHMSYLWARWGVFLMWSHHQGFNQMSQHSPPISNLSFTCISVCGFYIIFSNICVFLICYPIVFSYMCIQTLILKWMFLTDFFLPILEPKQMTDIWNLHLSFLFWSIH